MPDKNPTGTPTSHRYSEAEKERAVRAVLQLRKELGTEHGTVKRVAEQLGIGAESLRKWVNPPPKSGPTGQDKQAGHRHDVGGHENPPTGGHEKSPPVATRRSPLAATSSPHPLIVARCRGSPGWCGRPS